MQNISVLTDFEVVSNTSNFRKIASPTEFDAYSFFAAGNFVFISNSHNRTIRFSLDNFDPKNITEDSIGQWVNRIRKLYPNF